MLKKKKLKALLAEYIPEVKTESYYGKGSDPVEIEEHFNVNKSEWDTNPDNAKRGYLLNKIKSKLDKFLANETKSTTTERDST